MMRFFDYPQGGNHMLFHDDDFGFDELHMDDWDPNDLSQQQPQVQVGDIGPRVGPPRMSRRARQTLNLMKTDWLDTPNSHVLHVDLPGVKRDHIKVSLEDKHLRIHGERPKLNEVEGTWRRMERPKGRFNRRYPLPDLDSVDVDAITARLEDGVLTVTIPIKKREDKLNVKNIEISI